MAQQGQQLTVQLESFNYSEASSLRSIAGHWDDGVSAGDVALSLSRFTLGYEFGAYTLQALQRNDSYFNYTNDTAWFLYQTENKLPLTTGETYHLNIQPKRSASRGIRFGYQQQYRNNLQIQGFLSLLSVTSVLQGYVDGSATVVGPNDYDISFHSDLVYQDDPLYGREAMDLSGDGYALDLIVHYEVNDNWKVDLELLDVAGELSIDDVPYTVADASSDVKTFDADGYVIYDPAISGIESQKDFTYKFEMQTHMSVSYELTDEDSLVAEYHGFKNFAYRELQWVRSGNDSQIAAHLIPEISVFGVSYESTHFMIGVLTDDTDYKKMKYLELYSSLRWSF